MNRTRATLVSLALSSGLLAAACGDDDPEPANAPVATNMSEDSMAEDSMTDDSMPEDSMTEDSMTGTTAAP
jgi:hypothetical protein